MPVSVPGPLGACAGVVLFVWLFLVFPNKFRIFVTQCEYVLFSIPVYRSLCHLFCTAHSAMPLCLCPLLCAAPSVGTPCGFGPTKAECIALVGPGVGNPVAVESCSPGPVRQIGASRLQCICQQLLCITAQNLLQVAQIIREIKSYGRVPDTKDKVKLMDELFQLRYDAANTPSSAQQPRQASPMYQSTNEKLKSSLEVKSMKDLKADLDALGVSYEDCIEKGDLVQKLMQVWTGSSLSRP